MNTLNNKPSIPTSWYTTPFAQEVNPATSSVELLDQPTELTASENLQVFSFIPKAVATPVNSKLELLVVGATPVAEQLVISGFGITVTLTSSSTPSFDQFYTDNTNSGIAKQKVARAVADELNNNLAFNNYYEVTTEDAKIVIEARVPSVDYDLTVTTLPSSFITLVNVSGVSEYDYQSLLDYSTYVEIYNGTDYYGGTTDRSEFNLIGNIDIPFSDNESNINVNGATKNYVDVVLPAKRPNVGFDFRQLDEVAYNAGIEPILRPYFVTYSDSYRYATNAEKKRILQGCSDIRWVQNAAQHKLNAYFLEDYVWNPNTTNAFKYLTDRPNLTPVTYDSHQYLQMIFRINNKATGTFWLEYTTYYYDGTAQVHLLGGTTGFPYSFLKGNLSFDVSPSALGIENIESTSGKQVDYYEVQIKWQSNPTSPFFYSELKSYKMFRRCGDQSNNVIWFNKFGGWDSLEFLGTKATTINRAKQEVNRALPFTANGRAGRLSIAASEEVKLVRKIDSDTVCSLTSNLLPNGHFQWVGGILDSTAVFIWDTNLEQYVAITIDSYDYSYNTELDEFAIRIEYTKTVDNNTITR